MILVSGVPTTIEDEEGRLLRVARRVVDLDTPLSVSIGVNRGHVFSGEIGVDARATYTIMGDTVNLAARLMQAAPSGSVYATAPVVDRSLSLFETFDIEPLRVKGKADVVRAISVGPESGSRSLTTDDEGLFVGRHEELRTLQNALTNLRDGKGGAFTISGPTGIGKTRLLSEALGGEQTVVEVRAEPYGTAIPYRSFRNPVRRLLGIDPTDAQDLSTQLRLRLGEIDGNLASFAPLLGDIAQIDATPTPETEHISGQFRQDRAADILIELLDRVAGDAVVLTFEDAQWADAASLALLGRLVRAAAECPWLVIETSRDEAKEGSLAIPLEPLERGDIEALIYAETESAPLRPDVVAAIVDRSGGSPLFAHELLHVIKATGDPSTLPTSLEGVVGSQIDALEPLARRILRYVSVLGRSFRTSVARDLIRTQGVELDSAARSALVGFLDNDGEERLQFRHAMVRDVAYEGLSFKRRRELHRHAGQLVLDRNPGAEETVADILALHFYQAEDFDRAWTYSSMAGNRNMDRYANAEAATQFERALDAAVGLAGVGDADRREVYLKLGHVRGQSGEFDSSIHAYRQASRLTGNDPLQLAEILLKMARARERAGLYPTALGDTTRVRNLLGGATSIDARSVVADALSCAALIRQAQQRPKESLRLALRSARLAEEADNQVALARTWSVLDWSYFMIGQPEKAVYSRDALDIYQRIGDLRQEAAVSTNLGGFAFFSGDWSGALEYYEQGREASLKAGNTIDAAHAAANIGEVLVNQGLCARAEGPLREARRTYRASSFAEGVVFVDILLGRMQRLNGDSAASEESLRAAIGMAEELGLEGWVFEALVYLADVRGRSGDVSGAKTLLEDAAERTPPEYVDHYAPLFARIYGSTLFAAGNVEAAVATVKEGLAVSEQRADTYEYAMLVRTLSRIAPAEVDAATQVESERALTALGVRSPK